MFVSREMLSVWTTSCGVCLFLSFAQLVSSSARKDFHSYVNQVARTFHSDWRENFLRDNPSAKNRFKLTKARTNYSSTDFVYPMILTVGSTLVHRNLKVARLRSNSSLIFVDILNLDYGDLPLDWTEENRATARLACRQVLNNARKKRVFDDELIETLAEKIHLFWMKRNSHRARKELLIPYAHLSPMEKDKDRRAVLLACRLFNELKLDKKFRTASIRFKTLEFRWKEKRKEHVIEPRQLFVRSIDLHSWMKVDLLSIASIVSINTPSLSREFLAVKQCPSSSSRCSSAVRCPQRTISSTKGNRCLSSNPTRWPAFD